MFNIDDRVEYLGLHLGTVTHKYNDYLVVKFDREDGRWPVSDQSRAFTLGGLGTGSHEQSPCGTKNADRGCQLVLIERKQTMLEYPLEPEIGYGLFDDNGRVVGPGDICDAHAMYGVINRPRGMGASELAATPDSSWLLRSLDAAKDHWKAECVDIDFARVENKLELLIGIKSHWGWAYADEMGLELYDDVGRTHSITIKAGTACLAYGLMSMDDTQIYLQREPREIVAVDGPVITFKTGDQVAITPRFRETEKLMLSTSTHTKRFLAQRQAERLAVRDKEPEPA